MYYFKITSSSLTNLNSVLDAISLKVTDAMNDELLSIFDVDEVKEFVFQMGPTKVPIINGFPAIVYQEYWHVVRDDVIKVVFDFLNDKMFYEENNITRIVLIPKIKDIKIMNHFRPISLCNSIYKIIAKVLANILNIFLLDMVSINQSAFVPNRQIIDNVLIAYKLIHALKNRRSRKKGLIAMKLDMSKVCGLNDEFGLPPRVGSKNNKVHKNSLFQDHG